MCKLKTHSRRGQERVGGDRVPSQKVASRGDVPTASGKEAMTRASQEQIGRHPEPAPETQSTEHSSQPQTHSSSSGIPKAEPGEGVK